METRLSLIVRLKNARDEAAWSEFLALYEPVILQLALRSGLKEPDAQDVCQQVLTAVAQDVEQWQPDGKAASFRRWLYRVARNRVVKFLVKERGRIRAEGGSDAIQKLRLHADDDGSLSEQIEREYRQQILLVAGARIRGEFQELTWRAFWMTCVEGRSVAETAIELNTSPGNIYVARSRIMARLREKVAELEGIDE